MDWTVVGPKDPRSQTTEVSRMVDRVFQKATGKSATPQEHAVWDAVVRNQKIISHELFERITPDLVIKQVVDVANDANAVNVLVANQGKFSTRLASTLRLEINIGSGCAGRVLKQSEFGIPILKPRESLWIKATSTERLKVTGLERHAYKLTADAKKNIVEWDETNNEKCVAAYLVK